MIRSDDLVEIELAERTLVVDVKNLGAVQQNFLQQYEGRN